MKYRFSKVTRFFSRLGPGLITGASDDDPSGIGTYSQAGAQFGLGMLWTMLFSYPFMCAIQLISARIGRVTGQGISGNIRRHYSKGLLYPIVGLLFLANTINIGADLAAMGGSVHLFIGGSTHLYVVLFAIVSLVLQIRIPYSSYVGILKWSTLSLFAYVGTIFVIHVPWATVLKTTLVPHLALNSQSLSMFVALLGTTISPYLFFWQASQEAEEVELNPRQQALTNSPQQAPIQFARIKIDTLLGMAYSNSVAFFIILTTGLVLNAHGVTDIQTAEQAAIALRPLAGPLAFFLFTIGIVGTGLLAIPVLAGSAAYAIGEALDLPIGLERKAAEAKGFYSILSVAVCFGMGMTFLDINPVKALFWTAVINGVVAVPVIVVMMFVSTNPKVMGKFPIGRRLRIMGWLTATIMLFAVMGMFFTLS